MESHMQTETQSITITQAKQDAASIFLAKVFNWMAAGLGITGLVAYGTAASGLAVRIINSPFFLISTLTAVFFLSSANVQLMADQKINREIKKIVFIRI